MTTESQNRILSIWATQLLVRTGTIALAAGVLLLTTGANAESQDAKAPTYSVLYSFTAGADGAIPAGGNLILDPEGNLYGTTGWGGDLNCFYDNPPGCGVVFRVDRTGKETVLHSFTGGTDGILSFSGLVRDDAGNLYGNTSHGGSAGAGVVFKLDRAGKETLLYTFTGGADGGFPGYGILRDGEGNIYAAAESGGDLSGCFGAGCGVVFKVDRTGKETVLYSFTGGADGASPNDMIRDEEANLYGTTISGGDLSGCNGQGCGVVFKLDRAGKETVLYSFTGAADGGNPDADLIRDDEGNLYSTADSGGELGCFGGGTYCGVVFEVDRTGKETVLHTFTGGTDGGYSFDGLVRDCEGNLYGTTGYGGDLSGAARATAAASCSRLRSTKAGAIKRDWRSCGTIVSFV